MDVLINEGERLEDLQIGGYRLIQNPAAFCFGIDAVLLSDFTRAEPNEIVVDIGTGSGVIPILLAAKGKGSRFVGLEINPTTAEMAQRSVDLNDLQDKINITVGDIKHANDLFKRASIDVVVSNPPYMAKGEGILNAEDSKAAAKHELLCDLEDVISGASDMLKFSGHFYMVHRPHRLADIIVLLRKHKLEPKCLRFVHAYADKEAILVLIEAVRGGKPFVRLKPPLIIYNGDGQYTEEVSKIYWERV